MVNQIIVVGRLGRDPELNYTTSGVAVCKFSIGCTREFKNKDTGEKETDWFNVTIWRNDAEFVAKYIAKGRLVAVTGRMECRRYTDNEGIKREAWTIQASNVSPLDRGPDHQAEGEAADQGYQPAAAPAGQADDFDPFADE